MRVKWGKCRNIVLNVSLDIWNLTGYTQTFWKKLCGRKTVILVYFESSSVHLISCNTIIQCSSHAGVDVYVLRPTVVTARSWNTIVIQAELIAWERTGSLLKGIICALVLFPSVWQEPSGWKGKAVEKETSVPDTGKSLFLFSPSQVSPGILISTIHLRIGR